MRDRLVKLLQDNSYLDVLDEEHWLLAAEQLLANGVVAIDTDVVSIPNRPLITQCMGRPIDEVINLIRRSEWISVDERLPEVRQRVLLYSYHDGVNTGYRADEIGRFYVDKSYPYRPTHWMPLPEPPKMKGGAE